jgi:hypothetical protein
MVGVALTAVMAMVAVLLSQSSGAPPSQTEMARTQEAGGMGPGGVKVTRPESGSMAPPQVWVPRKDQVASGPSRSVRDGAKE